MSNTLEEKLIDPAWIREVGQLAIWYEKSIRRRYLKAHGSDRLFKELPAGLHEFIEEMLSDFNMKEQSALLGYVIQNPGKSRNSVCKSVEKKLGLLQTIRHLEKQEAAKRSHGTIRNYLDILIDKLLVVQLDKNYLLEKKLVYPDPFVIKTRILAYLGFRSYPMPMLRRHDMTFLWTPHEDENEQTCILLEKRERDSIPEVFAGKWVLPCSRFHGPRKDEAESAAFDLIEKFDVRRAPHCERLVLPVKAGRCETGHTLMMHVWRFDLRSCELPMHMKNPGPSFKWFSYSEATKAMSAYPQAFWSRMEVLLQALEEADMAERQKSSH